MEENIQSFASSQPQALTCPKCATSAPQESFFCSHCGHKLKEPPLSTTVLRQIGIYLLSFFLPPLGLMPGIRYLRQPSYKANFIGFACIGLTVISIAITIWASLGFINTYQQILAGSGG